MHKLFSDERKQEYPNFVAADRPLVNPITPQTVSKVRAYRHQRIRQKLIEHDCAAILLYDPLNIRYATDCSDMQVWTMHNASRYAIVCADGPTICFEYRNAMHLAEGLDKVDEVRPAISWYYFGAGPLIDEKVKTWAGELGDIVRQYGGGNMRLAVDKMEPSGVDALRTQDVEIVEGQELTETARMIKSPDEIEMMKWTIRVCEQGMWRMRENSVAGKSENEIWAELHYENIRNGGEWIETRLLTIGERTNPWFQECSAHVGKDGDMLSFDTDMVGPYGYCADISRSWIIGGVAPSDEQRTIYNFARSEIEHNMSVIRPGMSFAEFSEKSMHIPQQYHDNRYSCAFHGVGLCDEYPTVPTHVDFELGRGYPGIIEEGMVLCIESCTGPNGGRECVKLESQVLVCEDGVEQLETFPFEDWG
jgi:Xaa-Pro dipeptidase